MQPSERLRDLFDLYCRSQCSPEEVREFVGLLRQENADEVLTPAMKALWDRLRESPDLPALNASGHRETVDWEGMYQQVTQTEEGSYRTERTKPRRSFSIVYQVAAVFILVIAGAAIWMAIRPATPTTVATALPAGSPDLTAETRVHPISLPPSERRRVIHLPDGSVVMLNKNSSLEYPASFSGNKREVSLQGEAFFDIRSLPGKPFLVRSGRLITRVLGTAFDIRAYPGDTSISITVSHGRVQVMDGSRSIGLLSGAQQLSVGRSSGLVSSRVSVDTQKVMAWTPQEFGFDDITMEDVAKRIDQRFGTHTLFADPAVLHCRVTAGFYEDDGLDEVLNVICGVVAASYEIHDHQIIIHGKGYN